MKFATLVTLAFFIATTDAKQQLKPLEFTESKVGEKTLQAKESEAKAAVETKLEKYVEQNPDRVEKLLNFKDKIDGKESSLESKFTEMCKKFNEYFEYALKMRKHAEATMKKGFVECSTSQECGTEGKVKFCCANAAFHHRASNSKENTYRCMSRKVADKNVNVEIGDFEV